MLANCVLESLVVEGFKNFSAKVIDVFKFSDIDECQTTDLVLKHNCHRNASCSNTHGSFLCTCVSVYTGDGVDCTGILYQLFKKLQFFSSMLN